MCREMSRLIGDCERMRRKATPRAVASICRRGMAAESRKADRIRLAFKPLEAPARRVGMSLRNFVRRFKDATGDSPLIYLQKLRVAAAKRLLESDHRTMQEISDAVGYQDVAFFRSLFQRHTGVSPSAYRRRFGL